MEFTQRSLEIGPFDIFGLTIHPTIHWYGVIIVTGIILGTSLVVWITKRDDEDPEIVWNGVIWVVLLAVIGARLWSVIFPAGSAGDGRSLSLDYLTDLDNGPLAIWSGGLSIFGAIVGGLLGIIIYTRRQNLEIWKWADRVVIGVPLGQAIGRWGNYVNQELYGRPSDLPWAIKIDNPLSEYAGETHFHPLFLYESIGSLILCGILLYLWHNRRQKFQVGDFLLIYGMGYAVIRFLLEFIRVEIPTVSGVNVSQLTTAAMFIVAVWIFVMRHWRGQFVGETYPAFGQTTKQRRKSSKSSKTSQRPKAAKSKSS